MESSENHSYVIHHLRIHSGVEPDRDDLLSMVRKSSFSVGLRQNWKGDIFTKFLQPPFSLHLFSPYDSMISIRLQENEAIYSINLVKKYGLNSFSLLICHNFGQKPYSWLNLIITLPLAGSQADEFCCIKSNTLRSKMASSWINLISNFQSSAYLTSRQTFI